MSWWFWGWAAVGSGSSPHPDSDILQEDDFFILQEDGTSTILQEG